MGIYFSPFWKFPILVIWIFSLFFLGQSSWKFVNFVDIFQEPTSGFAGFYILYLTNFHSNLYSSIVFNHIVIIPYHNIPSRLSNEKERYRRLRRVIISHAKYAAMAHMYSFPCSPKQKKVNNLMYLALVLYGHSGAWELILSLRC